MFEDLDFPEFESVTGFPTRDQKDNSDIKQAELVLNKSDALKTLTTSPGWLLVEEHLAKVIESLKEDLLNEDNQLKVIRLQSLIKSLKVVPSFIKLTITNADKALEILNSLKQ